LLFTIRHHTRYAYSRPVRLGPQVLRFQPRHDGAQRVIEHRLDVGPEPQGANEHIDLEGNRATQVWFEGETDHLEITLTTRVQTLRRRPFDFILLPEATHLPISHAPEEACAHAYLERISADDSVTAFAAELSLSVDRETLAFLGHLNRRLYDEFDHVHRQSGSPQTPAHSLRSRRGACRDLAVLFVDCCRAEGIAARFASGYQRGELSSERRELHAWPEVYLPGAGWRGYDPTHGDAIADSHVTVAAAAHAGDTMPVTGSFVGTGATSHMDFTLEIAVQEDRP
jgi:transglutaminase-like putative cysteine protease